MPELAGAYNTRSRRPVAMVRSANAALRELRKGMAVIGANVGGMINAYDDFDGKYRCEAYRWMRTVDSQIYTSLEAVRKWWVKWQKKIGERPKAAEEARKK